MKQYMMMALLWSTILAFPVSAQSEAASSTRIAFGVVPQQSATKLARLWSPIFSYLSAQTGYHIIFQTAKDIPTFEHRLAKGVYDIAYMNPYHYTVVHDAQGYRAFAKAKDTYIQGIVVVHKNSPYRTLAELANQTIAFPSPGAFAASILPRAHLAGQDIPFIPSYVTSHDSVYHGVARGFFVAGGGITRTLNSMQPTIHTQLRILWTTKPYTPHVIAGHRRMSVEVIKRVESALTNMHTHPEGRALLTKLYLKGFESARDPEWNDVRHLDIQQNLASRYSP